MGDLPLALLVDFLPITLSFLRLSSEILSVVLWLPVESKFLLLDILEDLLKFPNFFLLPEMVVFT